jgi:hypothetical protein
MAMQKASRKNFLLSVAMAETAAGVSLLVMPAVVFVLLLGSPQISVETSLIARLAGVALLALGVASWIARFDELSAQRGLLIGILVYNVGASILLAYASVFLDGDGILLWPVVAFHIGLAVWGISCLRER